jgi:hypothetical protein
MRHTNRTSRSPEAIATTENLRGATAAKHDRRLAYTVAQLCLATGLGRTSIFEAIKTGQLASSYVAGRRIILADDAEAWLLAGREGGR